MGLKLHKRHFARASACLALLLVLPDTVFGQRTAKKTPGKAGSSASKSARAKTSDRSRTVDRDAPVSDKIVLRDGKELLGQVVDGSSGSVVVARREWLKAHVSDRMAKWEEAERAQTGTAREQRARRLQAWRQERPSVAAPGDRITPWLDRELARGAGADTPPALMAIRLGKGEATSIQRRGDQAARALRAAWILGLKEPEPSPLDTLSDSIAGRGTQIEADDPVAIDGLLPPSVEPDDRWLLRRAATEVLNDEGLRYIRFGNTVLPEPVPGQIPDATLGPKLVEGTIKDVLTGGLVDPLPDRLRSVADRGRIGTMVTRIDIAADFGSVAAESTLYYRGQGGWDCAAWRSVNVRVGEVPPFVMNAVASDPQVKALLDFVDAIGGGLVSPQMKQTGLTIGTSAGGAAVMARSALTRSLIGLAFDLEAKKPIRRAASKPWAYGSRRVDRNRAAAHTRSRHCSRGSSGERRMSSRILIG